MANGAIHISGGNSVTTMTGTNIPLGNTVRKFGNCIEHINNTIYLNGRGYYYFDAMFVIQPSAAGTINMQMYKDGNPITNAMASVTVAAVDTNATVTIPAIVRVKCACDDPIEITYQVTGGTVEVVNTSIVVEKL